MPLPPRALAPSRARVPAAPRPTCARRRIAAPLSPRTKSRISSKAGLLRDLSSDAQFYKEHDQALKDNPWLDVDEFEEEGEVSAAEAGFLAEVEDKEFARRLRRENELNDLSDAALDMLPEDEFQEEGEASAAVRLPWRGADGL